LSYHQLSEFALIIMLVVLLRAIVVVNKGMNKGTVLLFKYLADSLQNSPASKTIFYAARINIP